MKKEKTIKILEWIDTVFNKNTGKLEEVYEEKEYKVGDPCTIIYYSDRKAATIIDISKDGKVITVQEDKSIRTDKNGMSEDQYYIYERNLNGSIHTFKRTRKDKNVYTSNGLYYDWGTKLGFGYRRTYFDYSF